MISIIILNYNTAAFTRECLYSILKYKGDADTEIIVVDNNSSERSIENLADEFDSVRFYFRITNDGFAGGCNFGANKANGNYLMFLNPDVQLSNFKLSILTDYLDNNESAGVVSGLMLDENKNVLYFYNNFPSLSWEISQLYSPNLQDKINFLNSKKEIIELKNFEVDWFHGAFMMMRKSDFIQAGRFNENYFMYYEDVELCYKFKNILKKKNICVPEFKYFHSTKSSLNNEKNDNIYVFHINRGKLLFIGNYKKLKRSLIYFTGLSNIISRIIFLPFWSKYKHHRKEKFNQLLKVLQLYLDKNYLNKSKFEYIK